MLLLFTNALMAQVSQGGLPQFLKLEADKRPQLSKYALDAPSAKSVDQNRTDYPDLFALPVKTALNPNDHGQWIQLDNGDRIWYLEVHIPNADGLAFSYRDVYLPPGSRLFMFSPSGNTVLGAYGHDNNNASGLFRTGFIKDNTAILEYYEPSAYRAKGHFEIFRIDYAYESPNFPAARFPDFGFGTSNPCNINVNCPEGTNWQDEKQGVCRIQMVLEEGTGWCSGTLLNNALEDGTPYILSGYHCQDGYTPIYEMWRFDFNYESATCSNPQSEPIFNSVLGCVERAGYQASDFLLLEATNNIPPGYNVYYNGWNNGAAAPDSSTHIHHPNADIKKISLDTQLAVIHPLSIDWNNGVTTPPDHHLRVTFDHGTFESGSSGGPLFDNSGKVIGQLHGGIPGCDQVITYHGRFHISWDGGGTSSSRLSDWLDPNNDGLTMIGGTYDPNQGASADISGRISTEWGEGIANVSVILIGAVPDTVVTDTSGNYLFADLPIDQGYTIRPEKDINASNGVSTLDMLGIRKHILGIELLGSGYKYVSADANNTASVSTLDMVAIQKVILQLESSFPGNTSWRFVDADFPLGNPPAAGFPEEITVDNLSVSLDDLDFKGTKVGDVNESANPDN